MAKRRRKNALYNVEWIVSQLQNGQDVPSSMSYHFPLSTWVHLLTHADDHLALWARQRLGATNHLTKDFAANILFTVCKTSPHHAHDLMAEQCAQHGVATVALRWIVPTLRTYLYGYSYQHDSFLAFAEACVTPFLSQHSLRNNAAWINESDYLLQRMYGVVSDETPHEKPMQRFRAIRDVLSFSPQMCARLSYWLRDDNPNVLSLVRHVFQGLPEDYVVAEHFYTHMSYSSKTLAQMPTLFRAQDIQEFLAQWAVGWRCFALDDLQTFVGACPATLEHARVLCAALEKPDMQQWLAGQRNRHGASAWAQWRTTHQQCCALRDRLVLEQATQSSPTINPVDFADGLSTADRIDRSDSSYKRPARKM